MNGDTIVKEIKNNLADLLKDKFIDVEEFYDSDDYTNDTEHIILIGISYKNAEKPYEALRIETIEISDNITYKVGFINPLTNNLEDLHLVNKFELLTDVCNFINTYFYKVINLRQKIITQYKLLVNDANVEWKMML